MATKKVVILGSVPWQLEILDWDQKAEYWAINNMWVQLSPERMSKITAWFDLHLTQRRWRRWQYQQEDWLQEEHPFPIYMQEKSPLYLASKEFPIKGIGDKLLAENLMWGDEPVHKWFGCSHAFMTALAIYQGYKEIEYCGVNLTNPVEVYMERPSFFFWLGYALGQGIKVKLPEESDLLWKQTYAYDDPRAAERWMPKSIMMYTHTVEMSGDLMGVQDDEFSRLANIVGNTLMKEIDHAKED